MLLDPGQNEILNQHSLCVATHSSACGEVEYQGVFIRNRTVIFHKHPIPDSTIPLAEFLAIVHALAHLKKEQNTIPIYSASDIALEWVQNKQITEIPENSTVGTEMLALTDRALGWLHHNSYMNLLLKWNRSRWGAMPVAFNRNCPSNALTSDTLEPSQTGTLARPKPDQLSNQPSKLLFQIEISGKTYPFKQKLAGVGLTWNGRHWSGSFSMDKIEILKGFCQRRNLQYSITGNGVKESRLSRGMRPISYINPVGVMGEGRLQWAIDETYYIEGLRRRQNKRRKRS